MARIRFVREFESYNDTWYDVAYYSKCGNYVGRLFTFTSEDLPKTVKKWLDGKNGVAQYDSVFKRHEIIYREEQ